MRILIRFLFITFLAAGLSACKKAPVPAASVGSAAPAAASGGPQTSSSADPAAAPFPQHAPAPAPLLPMPIYQSAPGAAAGEAPMQAPAGHVVYGKPRVKAESAPPRRAR